VAFIFLTVLKNEWKKWAGSLLLHSFAVMSGEWQVFPPSRQ